MVDFEIRRATVGLSEQDAAAIAALPTSAQLEFHNLEERSRRFERAADAVNTIRAYASRWKLFVSWCRVRGLSALPVHPDVLRIYIVSLEQEGCGISTVQVTLAAIMRAHRAAGCELPKSERLSRVVRGMKRALNPLVRHAEAISITEIRALVAACVVTPEHDLMVGPVRNRARFRALRDRALILTSFLGGLRRSEAVGLDLGDVKRDPDGYIVTIRTSKGDQQSKGQTVGLPLLPDPEICAVRAIEAWLALRAELGDDVTKPWPLFPSTRGRRLGGNEVLRILARRAQEAGLANHDQRFHPHGLRKGFATESFRRGAKLEALKKHLRHQDIRTTLIYIAEAELMSAENPARKIA